LSFLSSIPQHIVFVKQFARSGKARIFKHLLPPPNLKKAEICQKKSRKDQDLKKQKMLALRKQQEMAIIKKKNLRSQQKNMRTVAAALSSYGREQLYG
jgi:hypothetical protein